MNCALVVAVGNVKPELTVVAGNVKPELTVVGNVKPVVLMEAALLGAVTEDGASTPGVLSSKATKAEDVAGTVETGTLTGTAAVVVVVAVSVTGAVLVVMIVVGAAPERHKGLSGYADISGKLPEEIEIESPSVIWQSV